MMAKCLILTLVVGVAAGSVMWAVGAVGIGEGALVLGAIVMAGYLCRTRLGGGVKWRR